MAVFFCERNNAITLIMCNFPLVCTRLASGSWIDWTVFGWYVLMAPKRGLGSTWKPSCGRCQMTGSVVRGVSMWGNLLRGRKCWKLWCWTSLWFMCDFPCFKSFWNGSSRHKTNWWWKLQRNVLRGWTNRGEFLSSLDIWTRNRFCISSVIFKKRARFSLQHP